MTWEAKVQLVLLGILMIAMLNFLIGSFLPGSEVKQARGFVGYNLDTFVTNFQSDYQGDQSFASVFGVFFPAVTGILAGNWINLLTVFRITLFRVFTGFLLLKYLNFLFLKLNKLMETCPEIY